MTTTIIEFYCRPANLPNSKNSWSKLNVVMRSQEHTKFAIKRIRHPWESFNTNKRKSLSKWTQIKKTHFSFQLDNYKIIWVNERRRLLGSLVISISRNQGLKHIRHSVTQQRRRMSSTDIKMITFSHKGITIKHPGIINPYKAQLASASNSSNNKSFNKCWTVK